MAERGLYPGLEMRLTTLATRIAALRQKMSHAKGLEKIEEFGEIEELERRHKVLANQLRNLDREGPGFRQDVKAEFEKMADDLASNIEDFMMWIDSDGHPNQRPKRRGKQATLSSDFLISSW